MEGTTHLGCLYLEHCTDGGRTGEEGRVGGEEGEEGEGGEERGGKNR